MAEATISHVLSEFESFAELLEDAYWEAATLTNKDFIFDVLSVFSKELSELNKLSIQDHHYQYECISEGVRRIQPKLAELAERKAEIVGRTTTLQDLGEVLSNIIVILESQNAGL